MKKAPDNLDLNRAFFGPVMGVRIKQVFLVTGQYDGVAILEADSDHALARMMLAEMLDAHRNGHREGLVFPSSSGTPLNLQNLAGCAASIGGLCDLPQARR